MGLFGLCPLLLMAPALLLGGPSGTQDCPRRPRQNQHQNGTPDSSWDSLICLFTAMWQPDQSLFYFDAVLFLDDQTVGYYDSITRKVVPQVPWAQNMEKKKEFSELFEVIQLSALTDEQIMKKTLLEVYDLYNRSGGLPTLQCAFGCALSNDGHKRGSVRFAYNGEDYISFDKETLTWTAAVKPAQVTKREWDAKVDVQFLKTFLEKECIWGLQLALDHGRESLLRREPPVVRVTRKASYDGMETLVCRAYGFHPKKINVTWWKDGEVWEEDTVCGGVIPNSDGTYHIWLSIKIDPEDRDHFWCHVEHDSLPEPLNVAWGEHTSSKTGLIVGALGGVVAAVLAVVGIIFCIRRRQGSYQAVSS